MTFEPYRSTLRILGRIARLVSLRRSTILCLHSVVADEVSDEMAGSLSMRARFIVEMASMFRGLGVDIVPLSELLERVGRHSPGPCVALTFDDGYRDNYEILFPIVKRLDLPVTIFLATGLIDRDTPMWWNALEKAIARSRTISWASGQAEVSETGRKWQVYQRMDQAFRRRDPANQRLLVDELASLNRGFRISEAYGCALTWSMIREMSASGLVEFGCHSVDHPVLSQLTFAEVERQVLGSRERLLFAAGLRARYFAYPFGRDHEVGPLAPKIVEMAGFDAGLTTNGSVLHAFHLAQSARIPRIMLASKAQDPLIVQAYISGLPTMLGRMRPRELGRRYMGTRGREAPDA